MTMMRRGMTKKQPIRKLVLTNYPITSDLLYPCKTAGFHRFQTDKLLFSVAQTLGCRGLSVTQAAMFVLP